MKIKLNSLYICNIYSQKAALSAGFKQLNDYAGMRDYEKIRKY